MNIKKYLQIALYTFCTVFFLSGRIPAQSPVRIPECAKCYVMTMIACGPTSTISYLLPNGEKMIRQDGVAQSVVTAEALFKKRVDQAENIISRKIISNERGERTGERAFITEQGKFVLCIVNGKVLETIEASSVEIILGYEECRRKVKQETGAEL